MLGREKEYDMKEGRWKNLNKDGMMIVEGGYMLKKMYMKM